LQFKGEGEENLTMLGQGLFISSDIQAIEFVPNRNGVKVRVIEKNGSEYEVH
jgi:hypothetical protein